MSWVLQQTEEEERENHVIIYNKAGKKWSGAELTLCGPSPWSMCQRSLYNMEDLKRMCEMRFKNHCDMEEALLKKTTISLKSHKCYLKLLWIQLGCFVSAAWSSGIVGALNRCMCGSWSRISELLPRSLTCVLYLDPPQHGTSCLKEASIKGLPQAKHSNKQGKRCRTSFD